MNWRTTNLAKFIVASPKAILYHFSFFGKQESCHKRCQQNFTETKVRINFKQKTFFSKCTSFMCALSVLITIPSTYHKQTHAQTQTHLWGCVCVRVSMNLCPLLNHGVFIRCWFSWNYSTSMCLCDILSK